MPAVLIKKVHYPILKKSIAKEIVFAAETLRKNFQSQLVLMYWNVGRILRQASVITDHPRQDNALYIQRLCRDFDRSEKFFYDCAKFHRLYPVKAPHGLAWSHYDLLIRIDDPKKRLALARQAALENISVKNFRILIRNLTPVENTPSSRGIVSFSRGIPYHYRVVQPLALALEPGWALIDLGFNVQKAVRYHAPKALHSGLIVRSLKQQHEYTIRISAFKDSRLYTYQAKCQRVIDGDTIVAHINMGFHCWSTHRLRFRGIDAPEKTCALGQKAKQFVKERLKSSPCIIVHTFKQDKYGRFLADIFYKPGSDDPYEVAEQGTFLNQQLIDEGLAVVYG